MAVDAVLKALLSRFSFFGEYLRVAVETIGEAIGRGHVEGSAPLSIIAENASILNVLETVWPPGGVYVWATESQTITVRSDSASDDDGSTGAWVVRIWWLNEAYDEAYFDVTMDGLTPVVTAVDEAWRVNRVECLTCGTAGRNVGNISVYWTDNSTRFAYVPAGYGVSSGAVQTVPAGKRDVIPAMWVVNLTTVMGTFFLMRRTSPTSPWLLAALVPAYFNESVPPIDAPPPLEAGTDYMIEAIGSSGSNAISVIGTLAGTREDA